MVAPSAGSPDELPIDVELIKVLAADSRRDILRLLGERRKTLTELAEALGLGKATVLEHLKKLQEAQLIRRLDGDERLWVYYELSPRGKRLVHPGRTRFYLIMAGTAAACLLLGAIVAAALLSQSPAWAPDGSASKAPVGGSENAFEKSEPEPTIEAWRLLDENVTIAVPAAPEGARLLVRSGEETLADAPIIGGNATFTNAALDALAGGRYQLAVRGDGVEAPLLQTFVVREPSLAVFPLALVEGVNASLVEVALAPPAVSPPASVRVNGELHEAPGSVIALTLAPSGALSVGRAEAVHFAQLPRHLVNVSHEDGRLVVRASAGVDVALDGATIGRTNESGILVAAWPVEGEHALRLVDADARADVRPFLFGADTATQIAPRLRIEAFDARLPETAGLRVRADLYNDGPAEEIVTVAARQNGALLATTLVSVPAHSRAGVLLVAPYAAPDTLDVLAHAARPRAAPWAVSAVDVSGDERAYEADAGAPQPTPTPAAPAAPATGEGGNGSVRHWLYDADFVSGAGADAKARLALAPPRSAAPAAVEQMAPAPAVPLPSAVLVIVAVAIGAWLMRRR